MGNLKGTRTEQNLLGAFAGESQARNRYTYFAAAAKKEGLQQIASIFEERLQQVERRERDLADRLEAVANEIDKKSNFVTGGLLLIGGAVAIANRRAGSRIGVRAESAARKRASCSAR